MTKVYKPRALLGYIGYALLVLMNSTKVQNPRLKMQVALLAEPKTPLELSVFIKYRIYSNSSRTPNSSRPRIVAASSEE